MSVGPNLTGPNVTGPVESRGISLARRLGGVLLTTVVAIALILTIWQLFLIVFDVDPFVGRGPDDVWRHLFTDPDAAANRSELIDASVTTLIDAALGLVAGSLAAVTLAIMFNLRRGVEQTLMPMAMVLQSVPLVAMTPLIALIFGRGLVAVTLISGIVTFFPTLVNVSIGLRSARPESIDLCRAYGATPLTTLRKVQIPAALPALFASLRIAAPLALIGGLLAEWLATGQGLGYLMLRSLSSFQLDQLWAAVVLVTMYSIIIYSIISVVERLVLERFGDGATRLSTL